MLLEALTILLIGDSHTMGEFGQTISRQLAQKNTVHTYAVCGSSMRGWITGNAKGCGGKGLTEPAGFLIAKHKPDLVIYGLGSNGLGNPPQVTERDSRELARMAPKCIWIGPPDMRVFRRDQFQRFYDALVSGIWDRCRLVDSELLTKYPPGGDGIHYWGAVARSWAMDALERMTRL